MCDDFGRCVRPRAHCTLIYKINDCDGRYEPQQDTTVDLIQNDETHRMFDRELRSRVFDCNDEYLSSTVELHIRLNTFLHAEERTGTENEKKNASRRCTDMSLYTHIDCFSLALLFCSH